MKRLKSVVKAFLFTLCLISGLFGGSNLGVNAEEQTSTEVTRIEWLKALTEAFEMQVDESNYPDNYYSDIDASSEDYYEVMLATEFGLIDVEAGDALCPDDAATREFAAHTLNLCMGYFMEEGTEYTFSEAETVKYAEDIQIAIDKGWLELSGTDFLPEQGITVAEKEKMIAAAESVVASTVIDSAYAGQFELVEGVLVIPEETEIVLTNENELTMNNCPIEIAEGDIFVVFSDGFPIARKALTVTKEENTTVIIVESVDLEDAFVDIDVQGNIDADLTQVQAVDDEVQLAYIVGGTAEQAYEDGVTFYSLEEVGGQEVTAVIATKTIETTDQMRSTYGLKPEEHISIKCKITKVSADYDVSLLKQKAYLNVSGTVTFSANISSGDIPLGFEDSLVRVPIGVIGYFKPQLEAGLSGTMSLSMKNKVSVGVQWTAKDGVRLNSDFKKEAFTIQTQIEGKVGVKVAIGVDVGFLNAELYAKAGGKASIKVTTYTDDKFPAECKHVSAHLYAVIGGKVTFKLVIFKAEIALEKELMDEENSPVKIALHYEDGKAVSECTRDAMSEEEEGGDTGSSGTGSGSSSTGSTKKYKYYTPIDSQYTYSGANTGIASTGETYTIFEYSLNDNNQATITKYNGNVSALNIPETIDGYTVVGIGSKVFQNNSRLMLVNIPDTVTEIGTYAFAGCSNLADVTLSSSLTTLGSSSFYNCDELTSIEIPGAVTGIENSAFKSCSNLVSVVFSETSELINIADMAFAYCENLEQVDIPDGVTKIGAGSFGNCTKLSSVDLPISLNTIGAHAFYNCDNLASIEIPKNLKETYDAYIYEFAYDYQYGPFYGCNGLKSIVFEEGATLVPNGLFANCPGIEIIIIPNTITAINNYAFMNCDSLKEVTFSENLVDIADMAFAYCEKLEQVDISDGVTRIGAGSFGNCTKLSSVDLPTSLNAIGAHAFYNCDNLASIEIPKNLKETYDAYIYEFAYDYQYGPFYGCDGLKEITFEEGVTKIPNGLFANCSGVENIVIPETVTQINSNAFLNCVNMKNITLSNSITVINNNAFYGCKNLASVDLPDSLSSLGYFAFGDCDGLTCIEIPKNLASVGVTDVWLGGGPNYRDAGPFTYCDNLKEVSFEEGTENIVANLFTWCVGVEKVTMPNTVSQIGSSAFMNCYNLEEVLIGNSVTAIYGSAFKNCSSLLNVTIPDSVTEMGTYVFAGCSSLQSAKLPNIRKNVTEGTFQNCAALTTIELPESVIAIAKNAFQNSGLTTITIPQNVGTIGDYAFNNCDSLQAISIPDSVTTLGTYCFADCEMLSDVQLGSDAASVSYIGPYAFNNCDALQAIFIPDSVTTLGTYCFADCEKLTDIHLGTGLTQIMAYTFNLCPSIQKIVLPYRISTVAANAFTNCTGLTEITIPRATSSIANNTFSYPTKMTVYGIAGTYAEEWANSVGATFVNQEIPATEVTLSETALTINNGKTANLILSVTPADFTDAIAWKSSNEAVATVSDTGVVTAKGIGSATIRVTVGNLSASCKVTVVQPVTSITLNKTSLTLEAEETYSLSATVRPSDANDKTVTWSSSDETVATVSEDGVVTALKKGTAVITVSANDGSNISKSCTVTVTNTCYHCETIEELESSHNYENDCNDVWAYTLQGATKIAVTFDERTEVEEAFDYLYLYDAERNVVGEYTGTELAGQTITIAGDTVKVKLSSDSGGSAWGFKVTHVEEYCEHTFDSEWSSDEKYHWHAATCGHEQEIKDKEEHTSSDWIIDKEATVEEAGSKHKECTVCATILETEEILGNFEEEVSAIESFVTRMYQQCLDRDPDQEGLDGWVGQLENGNMNGAQIAEQFVFSNEMLAKNLSDEEFVNVLYRAMMGREADVAGRTGWVNQLSNGYMTRSEVTKAFVESAEFTEICTSYGITRGDYDASIAPIEHFVTRFYTLCLERKPDQAGLYGWVNNLKNQYMNGAQIAEQFFFSEEFVNRNVSDEKYIELLYNTLMGRPSDENGKTGWLGQLQNGNMTRKDMMKAFIESNEFTEICETYGITRGSL